jgi:DNA-binding response OmpR family regulator
MVAYAIVCRLSNLDVQAEFGQLLAGVHAFVVEDDPDARELVEIVLQRFGAEVICVATVGAALGALTARRPGVLLSDIGWPNEDGLTFIRRIRNTQGLTLAAGFQTHVAKPIELIQLANIVVEIISSSDRSRSPQPPS